MNLSKEQKELLSQILQTNIRKSKWVVDNKKLEEKKKTQLEGKICQMEEILQLLAGQAEEK